MNQLKSTEWLFQNLDTADVSIIDASWYLPTDNRSGSDEYQSIHIPGAHFFDLDEISDHTSDLPHMMPTASMFSSAIENMGISSADTIVVYDGAGLFSAARLWWMFKAFGHDNVFVLNGGLQKWIADGYPTTSQVDTPQQGKFDASLDTSAIVKASEILDSGALVLDARAPARFEGRAAEPRAGLRSGRIPKSTNLFFKSLLDEDGCLRSENELRNIFDAVGATNDQPIVASCGSGVTAAILILALHQINRFDNIRLYDGSWTEWGGRHDLPIEKG